MKQVRSKSRPPLTLFRAQNIIFSRWEHSAHKTSVKLKSVVAFCTKDLILTKKDWVLTTTGRPGALEVPAEEEISRVVPVIEGISRAAQTRKQQDYRDARSGGNGMAITISVDTRRAAVARAAVAAGAHAVNDVSGGTFDPDMLNVVAELGVPLIMMHMR